MTGMGQVVGLPRMIHQVFAGDPLPSMCWCSSVSWQRFATVHGWEYNLWRTADLDALVPRMVTPSLWNMKWPKATGMQKQVGIMRSCIARMEILRLYGGLYIDCDLLWLGAAQPEGITHAITTRMLSLLAELPARLTISTNSMRDSLNLTHRPIVVQTTMKPSPLGMWQVYFNNAVLAAGQNDSTIGLLLKELPRFVSNAVDQMKSTQEWRITGPEALNRALTATDEPYRIIPMKWIYPYDHEIYPPPSMNDVASRAFIWGELKPWHAVRLWRRLAYILTKTWSAPHDHMASHFDSSRSAGHQCFWDGHDWRLVDCNSSILQPGQLGACKPVMVQRRPARLDRDNRTRP